MRHCRKVVVVSDFIISQVEPKKNYLTMVLKKMQTASTNKLRFFSEGNGVFSWQITLGVVGLKKTCI